MTRNKGALHGTLKINLRWAKLGFVYLKIALFNIRKEAGDNEEDDVHEVQRQMGRDIANKKGAMSPVASGNEEALARKEPELKKQELRMREYEQRSKDEIFYTQPTDHLIGVYLDRAFEMKRAINEVKLSY
nr:hypothetical protein [Tanacetum cinerariifolium]